MNESLKIQLHHLERSAYLYIRQSSMRQVLENVESTKRQYALRERAIALGWRDDQIIVIDNDQGESGSSAAWREGFQRLVSDVGLGRAGIVMGLESQHFFQLAHGQPLLWQLGVLHFQVDPLAATAALRAAPIPCRSAFRTTAAKVIGFSSEH